MTGTKETKETSKQNNNGGNWITDFDPLELFQEELKQEEDVHAHIADLVQALTSNTRYYAPITQLPRSESVIFWVRPTWVRWADYTAGKAGENVLTEIPL